MLFAPGDGVRGAAWICTALSANCAAGRSGHRRALESAAAARLVCAGDHADCRRRTFRKRPWVSFFHSFIFYGFAFYLLVNLVDAVEGYFPVAISSRPLGVVGELYHSGGGCAECARAGGRCGAGGAAVFAAEPAGLQFNERTLLHEDVQAEYIYARLGDRFDVHPVSCGQPGGGCGGEAGGGRAGPVRTRLLRCCRTCLRRRMLRPGGYLGTGARWGVCCVPDVLPILRSTCISSWLRRSTWWRGRLRRGCCRRWMLNLEAEEPKLGAARLEDLAWPRLLDAYACIQCNRCQDVCPATATGKALESVGA